MESDGNPCYLSIAQARDLLRGGGTSSAALLEAVLARIGEIDPRLKAFALLDREGARAQAAASDRRRREGGALGPLEGIPLSVKDNYDTAGLPTRLGSPRFRTNLPAADAEMVKRLKAAGAVILGKTNLPPLAMDAQCANPLTGRSSNPWDPGRTPGGSSGGGAAAVSAGMSFAELCNDLLGSIRLPSHYCGVYGFMPSEACLPLEGIRPAPPGGRPFAATASRILRPGFIARSIEDLVCLMDACQGPSPREPLMLPFSLPRSGSPRKAGPRLAFMPSVGSVPVSEEYSGALGRFVQRLRRSGSEVTVLAPDSIDAGALKECFDRLVFGVQAASMPGPLRLMMKLAMRDPRLFSLDMRRYLAAESERAARILAWEEASRGFDAVLLPVSSTEAFGHRRTGSKIEVDGKPVDYATATVGLCFAFNLLGCPVLSMPMDRTEAGLPLGVQAVGKRFADFELLALAARLDAAGIGFRRPPLAAGPRPSPGEPSAPRAREGGDEDLVAG